MNGVMNRGTGLYILSLEIRRKPVSFPQRMIMYGIPIPQQPSLRSMVMVLTGVVIIRLVFFSH